MLGSQIAQTKGVQVMDIEKAEQPPKPKRRSFPFAHMDVGDSLFFEELTGVESAQNAAYAYGKKHANGFKVTRRKLENGYRLWRIA